MYYIIICVKYENLLMPIELSTSFILSFIEVPSTEQVMKNYCEIWRLFQRKEEIMFGDNIDIRNFNSSF